MKAPAKLKGRREQKEMKMGQCDVTAERGDPQERSWAAGRVVGDPRTSPPSASSVKQRKESHLFGRHIIASKASGGTQIFHQRIERLGLLVEKPDLERKRVSMTLLFCPQWVRMEGDF